MSRTHRGKNVEANLAGAAVPPAVALPTIGAKSFDPIDFVTTRIVTERARTSVLSSMAWYLDMSLMNAARQLYFTMYKELSAAERADQRDEENPDPRKQQHDKVEDRKARVSATRYENYQDFLMDMNEQEARERNLVEQGFMEGPGVRTMRTLLALRNEWHDAVDQSRGLFAATTRSKPTFEELLRNEKVQTVNALSSAKLRYLAEDGTDTPEEAEEMFNLLIERENMQAVDRYEQARQRIPAILGILHFVERTHSIGECQFSDLPLDLRERLITGMKSAVEQTRTRLATDRKVQVVEFMAMNKELKAVAQQLADILKGPQFNDGVDMTQAALDNARLDKDLAARGKVLVDGKYVDEAEAPAWNHASQRKHTPMQ